MSFLLDMPWMVNARKTGKIQNRFDTAALKRAERSIPNTGKPSGYVAVAGSAGATFSEAVAVRCGRILRNTVIPNAVDEMTDEASLC